MCDADTCASETPAPLVRATCACGRVIERELGGAWRHLDGWTMCDPRKPLEVARLHPASLPERTAAP